MQRFHDQNTPQSHVRERTIDSFEARVDFLRMVQTMQTVQAWTLLGMFVFFAILQSLLNSRFSPVLFGLLATSFGMTFVMLRLVWRERMRGNSALFQQLRAAAEARAICYDADGLTLASKAYGFGPVPWDVIERVESVRFPFPMLRVRLKPGVDTRAALGPQHWLHWWPGGFGIVAVGYDVAGEALAEEAERYRQRYGPG